MKTSIVIKSAAALALALTATACSGADADGGPAAASGQSDSGSVQELTTMAGRNLDVDYTPLKSPADAKSKADLIVRGTLVKVEDGIRLSTAGAAQGAGRNDPYVTFVIKVDKVLHGNARSVVDGKVYLSVYTSDGAQPTKLSALNPQANVVAVLDDITDWRPAPGVSVVRPANVPAGAHLYAPFTDGFWLQGRRDPRMFGIGAEHTELPAGWKHAKTVDQFAASFK